MPKKGIIFIRVAYSHPFLTGLWGNLAILVASGAIDSGSNPDSPIILYKPNDVVFLLIEDRALA